MPSRCEYRTLLRTQCLRPARAIHPNGGYATVSGANVIGETVEFKLPRYGTGPYAGNRKPDLDPITRDKWMIILTRRFHSRPAA